MAASGFSACCCAGRAAGGLAAAISAGRLVPSQSDPTTWGERWVFSKGGAGGYVSLVDWKIVDGEIVPIEKLDIDFASQANKDMASQAMRVLALCARKLDDDEDIHDVNVVESGFIFLGLVGIMDPPRAEVKDAIAICQQAGLALLVPLVPPLLYPQYASASPFLLTLPSHQTHSTAPLLCPFFLETKPEGSPLPLLAPE